MELTGYEIVLRVDTVSEYRRLHRGTRVILSEEVSGTPFIWSCPKVSWAAICDADGWEKPVSDHKGWRE